MKIIKTILVSLAAIAAATPATRADDMSELVAVVAASMEAQERMKSDVLAPALDTRPRYKPRPRITVAMLDGILSSMEGRASALPQRPMLATPMDFNTHTALATPFFRPVPGVITSQFGWRPAFNRVHHGVDLALEIGDTVRAAVSGTVDLISYDHDGYGHYVKMTHPDGMETLYGHLQYPIVAQGQFVYAGQPIGIGGNTGNSTGPHLHFEARLNGIAVDPLLIFDFYGMGQYLYAGEETPSSVPKTPVYSHQQKSLQRESTYIVRAGDTVESVARQAGISAMRLRQLNMLSEGDALPLGRMLKLR